MSNMFKKTRMMPMTKVIIHKSRGAGSLVEQDTIDYVSTAYFELKNRYYETF